MWPQGIETRCYSNSSGVRFVTRGHVLVRSYRGSLPATESSGMYRGSFFFSEDAKTITALDAQRSPINEVLMRQSIHNMIFTFKIPCTVNSRFGNMAYCHLQISGDAMCVKILFIYCNIVVLHVKHLLFYWTPQKNVFKKNNSEKMITRTDSKWNIFFKISIRARAAASDPMQTITRLFAVHCVWNLAVFSIDYAYRESTEIAVI